MPAYEIRYENKDGSMAARFYARCGGDEEAKSLMHAIQMEGVRQVSVWHGKRLIYTKLHAFKIPDEPAPEALALDAAMVLEPTAA